MSETTETPPPEAPPEDPPPAPEPDTEQPAREAEEPEAEAKPSKLDRRLATLSARLTAADQDRARHSPPRRKRSSRNTSLSFWRR